MNVNLKKNLAQNGWCIIDLKKKIIKKIKKTFQNKIYLVYPDFKKFDLEKLRHELSLPKYNKRLNKIKSLAIPNLSEYGLEGIKESLNSIFGKNTYLYQRNSHIDINVAKDLFTKTITHSEIMAGHSPFTFTIWVPQHDINDNSGLFLVDLKKSLSIIDNFDVNKKEIQRFLEKNKVYPKLKEGQAIIFSSFNLHGSDIHSNPKARISINFRIHPKKKELFQKDSLYFKQ
jgi:sporadic carbohydrate cluster 2OG-Fe(II) oxygenase